MARLFDYVNMFHRVSLASMHSAPPRPKRDNYRKNDELSEKFCETKFFRQLIIFSVEERSECRARSRCYLPGAQNYFFGGERSELLKDLR
jgi:hypothetical protein